MSIPVLRRAVAAAVVATALATPSAALADSVSSSTSFTDRFGWTYTATVEAHGGPFGEDAAGTMSWIGADETGAIREQWEGIVTCMTVDGDLATVTGTFTYASSPPHANTGFWLSFEDNPSDELDRMSWLGFTFFESMPAACRYSNPVHLVTGGQLTVIDDAHTPAEHVAHIDSLVAVLDLPPGNIHTLRKSLSDATAALESADLSGACTDLEHFTRDMANTPDGKLSTDVRARFLSRAADVRSDIGCE